MIKGWKTVVFNVLASIMPVLEVAGVDLGLEGDKLALYGLGVTVANIVLRYFTSTAIGKSE